MSSLLPHILGFGLIPLVSCIAFPGPKPTVVGNEADDVHGFSPKPTEGPKWGGVELFKRQYMLGPSVCGWGDGQYANPIACYTGYTCMLFTPSNVIGMAGCCSRGDHQHCNWVNSCVNFADISQSCGTDCLLNTFVRKCTDAVSPYCVSWTYLADAVQDYGCTDTDFGRWITVSNSYTDNPTTIQSVSLPYVAENEVTGWQTATSNASASAPTSASATSGSNTSSPSSKKFPIVPVAAGAAGGVVFCLALGCTIFCCLRNRKKQKANQPAQQAAQTAAFTAPPPTQPAPPSTIPPMQQISPNQQQGGYFLPPQGSFYSQPGQDSKPSPGVNSYPASPISSPSSPAPQYQKSNPYAPPPIHPTMNPQQLHNLPVQQHAAYVPPQGGAVEMHSVPVAPQQQPAGMQQPQQPHHLQHPPQQPVYEMQS